MLEKLKKNYQGSEDILGQQQIDKIFMDFLDITSSFLKLPSPDFTIFREDLADLGKFLTSANFGPIL